MVRSLLERELSLQINVIELLAEKYKLDIVKESYDVLHTVGSVNDIKK